MMNSTGSTCSLSSSFDPKKGLHTTFTTEYTGKVLEGCSFRLDYVLPSDVFVDPYELKYDIPSCELRPMPNLELPVKVSAYNTSTLSIRLDTFPQSIEGREVPTVKIPIHVRYGEPSSHSSSPYHSIEISAPRGYWLCPGDRDHKQKGTNDAEFFGVIDCSSTLFPPDSSAALEVGNVATLRIPVGSRADLDTVELSTTVLVLSLLVYLLWVFSNTARRLSRFEKDAKEE